MPSRQDLLILMLPQGRTSAQEAHEVQGQVQLSSAAVVAPSLGPANSWLCV